MEELSIQGRRDFPAARPSSPTKTEKTAGVAPEPARVQGRGEAANLLTAGPNAGEDRFRQSRLILQTGESVLTEVSDRLARMASLLRHPGGGSLSADLAGLGIEIDRLLDGAAADGVPLFRREDGTAYSLPVWLQNGIAHGGWDKNTLLAALGLPGEAGAEEILSALLDHGLGTNGAADYLTTLYLGALIAGEGSVPDRVDKEAMLDGIRRLLEMVNGGMDVDQAVAELTGGKVTSLAGFEAEFTAGTAPDLTKFLNILLLSEEAPALPPLGGLLDGLGVLDELEMDLWMTLGETQALPDDQDGTAAARTAPLPGPSGGGTEAVPANNAANPLAAGSAEGPDGARSSLQFGGLTVSGRDLSGVSCSEGVLTITGPADVVVSGSQPDTVIHAAGSGTVTLNHVRAQALTAGAPEVRVFTAGESAVERVALRDGATLVLDGGGLLETKQLVTSRTNLIRLSGGTLLADLDGAAIPARVEVNGPAILPPGVIPAARAGGGTPGSFDLIWKTLLPGAARLIAASVDGAPARLFLTHNSPARLWLDRGPDGSHGYPGRVVTLVSRDGTGRRRSQSLFLRWDGGLAQFQEAPLYPNPFQVSGGTEGEDWVYDPATRTLRVLTARAMTLSGGPGMDARQAPFSGRVALADGLGASALTLDGADCQVSFGRAFDLGRGNQVTLLLRGENYFQSGVGCAGLSLGEGTALLIDAAPEAAGMLTASGGFGGAGIGRDRNAGPDGGCRVSIRGGAVTARTFGAGAGIGAGRDGAVGAISIAGGTVFAFGGRSGGAAIGGAPGGPAGDITISGGEITVSAPAVANAIGAGTGSVCGEVRIARAARIIYKDGAPDPLAPKKPKGIPLDLGDVTVLLPRFRLPAEGLRIEDLDLSTPAGLQDARRNVSEASRRVQRIQMAYSEMFSRLETHLYSLWNVRSSMAVPVRSEGAAHAVLSGVKQAIAERPGQAVGSRQESAAGEIFRLLHQR